MTASISKEIIIAAPAKDIFDFLTDPNKIPLVLPGLIKNTNVPELPLKKGDTFKYEYSMHGVVLSGEWQVANLSSPATYEAVTTGGTESTWKYSLKEQQDGTKLKLEIEYSVPETVLEKASLEVVMNLNEKEVDQFLDNLKTALSLHNS